MKILAPKDKLKIVKAAELSGWRDCGFSIISAHQATDGSFCPAVEISFGKSPPNFNTQSLKNFIDTHFMNSGAAFKS